ncbi:MAG: O-linked N-acetylglucosamine transferase, SPINDLY family protein [Pseudanabaenaceae cyanobacterium]
MMERQADELYVQEQWEAAAALYERLVASTPHAPALWHFRLGVCRMDTDPPAAIAHFERAIAIDPTAVKAYINGALLCYRQGETQRAHDWLQRALLWEPENPVVWGNLVPVLLDLGQMAAAIAAGEKAIALSPTAATPYLNLSRALAQVKNWEGAHRCLQAAQERFPEHPQVWFNLGVIWHQQGRWEEAIAAFQEALRRDPEAPATYEGLGQALVAAGRFDVAVVALREAVRREPTAERWALLGNAYSHQDDLLAAIAAWEQAHALDPSREADYWRSRLVLPAVYESIEAFQWWGERFVQNHRAWAQATEGRDRTDPVVALGHSFYLAYRGETVLPWLRTWGDRQGDTTPPPPPPTRPRRRIALVSGHFCEHTIARLMSGWFDYWDRDRLEIGVYQLNPHTDTVTAAFAARSDRYFHTADPDTMAAQLQEDRPDLVIFPELGMNAQLLTLAARRWAPRQASTWMHPVTSGLPTIDFFLSSAAMEPADGDRHYREVLVRLPDLGIVPQRPVVPPPCPRTDLDLPTDRVLYLCCQSAYKYLPAEDELWVAIAQRLPSALFVCLASPTGDYATALWQQRLRRTFARHGLDADRHCQFLRRLNHDQYLQLNQVCDVFLDCHSWSGGHTTLEAIACGLPVVTWPSGYMRGRHSLGILKVLGLTTTVASSAQEYVELAVALGRDPGHRQTLQTQMYERRDRLFGNPRCMEAWNRFLRDPL